MRSPKGNTTLSEARIKEIEDNEDGSGEERR